MPKFIDIHKGVEGFISALTAHNFDKLALLFQPNIRFRALVPHRVCKGYTADEAIDWLRRWFGDADEFEVLQSEAARVFDRLYITYRLRVHDVINGWRVIEQHAYMDVKDNLIADMWLLCSGFRSDEYLE